MIPSEVLKARESMVRRTLTRCFDKKPKLEERRKPEAEAKNLLWVSRESFPGAPERARSKKWILKNRGNRKLELRVCSGCPKSTSGASNMTSGESKLSPGTAPEEDPEHVEVTSATLGPLVGIIFPTPPAP